MNAARSCWCCCLSVGVRRRVGSHRSKTSPALRVTHSRSAMLDDAIHESERRGFSLSSPSLLSVRGRLSWWPPVFCIHPLWLPSLHPHPRSVDCQHLSPDHLSHGEASLSAVQPALGCHSLRPPLGLLLVCLHTCIYLPRQQ